MHADSLDAEGVDLEDVADNVEMSGVTRPLLRAGDDRRGSMTNEGVYKRWKRADPCRDDASEYEMV